MNRELLNNNQRISYHSQLFGVHFPFRLEPFAYNTAGRLSGHYTGGYWKMFKLGNRGFYMAPDAETFQASCPNGYEGTLSGDAFGITVCLYTYSELSFSGIPDLVEVCVEQYHLLRAYMFEHPEVEGILRAID